jgi:hypothetical protein
VWEVLLRRLREQAVVFGSEPIDLSLDKRPHRAGLDVLVELPYGSTPCGQNLADLGSVGCVRDGG